MLTDTQCRTTKPKDKPYKLSDGKGLYLEIKPNGVKAWRYRFELREGDITKESIFAIGDYAIVPSGETPEEVQAVFRKYVDPAKFVTVAAGDGPALASRAATGRIALVLLPRVAVKSIGAGDKTGSITIVLTRTQRSPPSVDR